MEFNENCGRQLFSGFVLLWCAWLRWREQCRTRRALQRMSDKQLRELGLRRDEVD